MRPRCGRGAELPGGGAELQSCRPGVLLAEIVAAETQQMDISNLWCGRAGACAPRTDAHAAVQMFFTSVPSSVCIFFVVSCGSWSRGAVLFPPLRALAPPRYIYGQ